MDQLLTELSKGGTNVGWVLSAYLLWRLHKLTDAQVEANLKNAKVLSSLRTMLSLHFRLPNGAEDDE